ncbi:MAG: sugar transferase [Parasphingorhabdus sp.]|uniref:sugar transferase n=1 Tax=Parasphingorhabdus sp. TaxID=2709688 RepID=UPI0032638919
MTSSDRFLKRLFDLIISLAGLLVLWPIILVAIIVATFSTKAFGLFSQKRMGRFGKPFTIYKIRTMRIVHNNKTHITAANDARITPIGGFLRKTKIDELPQLWNVLAGTMSFVGPRPDMPEYAEKLKEQDKVILNLRPGITGPATLEYRDEEIILAKQQDPIAYNDNVIWPHKVAINRDYFENYSFKKDIVYIFRTITST